MNEQPIIKKWAIEGHPTYFVADDNELYHQVYVYQLRRCNKIMKGYSVGYILDSKFYTLKKLRTLLIRL